MDSRIRSSHADKNGIIKKRTDPFWDANYPPNAYNCRCKVQAYTKEDIDGRGWSETTKKIDNFADESFSYNMKDAIPSLETYAYQKALKFYNSCKGGKANNAKGISCPGREAFIDTINNIKKRVMTT